MFYNLCAAGSSLPLDCFSSACVAQVFGDSCLIFFFGSLVFHLKFWVWGVKTKDRESFLYRKRAQFELLKTWMDIPAGFRMQCGEKTWGQKT